MFLIDLKRLFGFYKRMNLIKKFITAYVLIIAVPMTILGVYAINSVATVSRQDMYKNELLYLQQSRTTIRRNIEVCVRAALMAANSKDLVQFLSQRQKHSTGELIDFKNGPLRDFEKIQNINPDIYQMRFFLDHTYIDEIWPSILHGSRLDKYDWKEKVRELKGKSYWRLNHPEDTIRDNDAPEEVISTYVNVGYAGNIQVAILEVNMITNVFFSEMYNRSDPNRSLLCLVKDQKEFYTGYNHGVLESFAGETQLIGYLNDRTEKKEGNFTFKTSHGDYLAVFSYVDELDAYLYKVTSLQGVNEKINRSRNLILLGMTGGFILLALVAWFITRALLKKTGTIITAMRRVQDGELDIDIPVEGSDEISEVAFHFKKMMKRINELIYMLIRKEAATKEAEIKALQSQINKHFVYNVLEAVKMMAEINSQYEIADTVTILGRLMRYSMSWKNNYVTLRNEIDHITNYISLLNIRYDNEIFLEVNVDEQLLDMEVLKMSLQPIVENACVHGLEPGGAGGKVVITAIIEDHMLMVDIEDNGAGMNLVQLEQLRGSMRCLVSELEPEQSSHGIGLRNVNERIKLFYGKEYGLEVYSEEGKYTRVRIKLPCLSV